jgi:RNA polymerase sigma-70 factor (ECF subfamily)
MTCVAARTTLTPHNETERWRRFHDTALPHLDTIYMVARCMLGDPSDAEDAVQECYLRALRHFDTLRGSDVKPWLFAILYNVCRVEYGRRSRVSGQVNWTPDEWETAIPLLCKPQDTPETETLRKSDVATIRDLVATIPDVFCDAIVLREIDDLSYREIAAIVGVPIGTVMSRLARGRAMLREAWLTVQQSDGQSVSSGTSYSR